MLILAITFSLFISVSSDAADEGTQTIQGTVCMPDPRLRERHC